MFRFIVTSLLLSTLCLNSFAQKKTYLNQLSQKIAAELKEYKGSYAIACKDLTSGETLLINEHQSFHAASTMKTPVMIEVYKQAAAGKFALTDSVVIKNEFISIVDGSLYSQDSTKDSEHELYKNIGRKIAIKDLVFDMITMSSNFATNMVIDLVGAKNVTKTMRQYGAKDMLILRGVEDNKAYEKGMNNTTTAYDLMLIFEKMALGQIVNKKSSDAMIEILLAQHFGSVIPARLPKDVKVAHKTGSLSNLRHDSGIVYLPDGRKYVLVILSRDFEEEAANIEMLAGISAEIYEGLK